MTNKNNILRYLFLIMIILLFGGCLKDKVTTPFSASTESNAKLLFYLEEQGDKINNIIPPALSATYVNNNLTNCLVVDVRAGSDFLNGHIPGAINVSIDTLFTFVQANAAKYNKVVLVSASGQSAAYYSALLIIAGFSNVGYLNFGMASWNQYFNSVWTDRRKMDVDSAIISYTYNNKNAYTSLPVITLNSAGETMEDFVKNRINALIAKGFDENYNLINPISSVTLEDWINIQDRIYTIFTGPYLLYNSTITYHLTGSVLYLVPPDLSDLRSISNLQTLPPFKEIVVYSGSGQESAFYTAYLRLLGYDAKSLLFGMNNIDYNLILGAGSAYAFQIDSTINYSYVTGAGKLQLLKTIKK